MQPEDHSTKERTDAEKILSSIESASTHCISKVNRLVVICGSSSLSMSNKSKAAMLSECSELIFEHIEKMFALLETINAAHSIAYSDYSRVMEEKRKNAMKEETPSKRITVNVKTHSRQSETPLPNPNKLESPPPEIGKSETPQEIPIVTGISTSTGDNPK